MRRLAVRAFAKVNLDLRALERRPDGYHELRTVYQTVSLADRLRIGFEPGGGISVELRANDSRLETAENLAARAARTLLESGPWRGRVSIELEKRIPVGGGLGGGSSDAGATLLALERLLDPPPGGAALYAAARQLGSDVPFFLLGGLVLGVGRGEEVYPLPDPPRRWVVIIAPELHVATRDAYQWLAESRSPGLTQDRKLRIIDGFCSGFRVSGVGETNDPFGRPSNDFEGVIFQRFPDLRRWKDQLLEAGATTALLSGSGAALFGLFESRPAAQAASRALRGEARRVHLGSTVSRRRYRALWDRWSKLQPSG